MTSTTVPLRRAGAQKLTELSWGLRGCGPQDIPVQAAGVFRTAVTPELALGSSTGHGVRVCVVDSGIEADHPAVGALSGCYRVDGEDLAVVETDPGDSCGHGTACASIIRQAAPDCELYSVQVLGSSFSGTGNVLLAGLRWAVQQRFDVINMSLSTTRPEFVQALHEMADDAFFARSVIVAAAHNSRVESFPWRFSSVISVGSHQQEDPALILYNPRPPVEFFAQGQNVRVGWLNGSTIRTTGNSFATPRITGLCTRILAKHPQLTVFELKSVLYQIAANVGAASATENEV
ncbi:MAG TPA: S8 family serine peptidase [Jatrophihabitans sp.]|jgi:subtilisin family serine protease|nr:S8 family serine peptidase [Jatrophihabitans sp.]